MDVTSVLVPSVQEMIAKEAFTTVPDRYCYDVLPVQDPLQPFLAVPTTSLPQIPVIDLTKLLSDDLNLKGPELDHFNYACKQWGFFQLVNHGISISLVENIKTGTKRLFELPMEEKKKLWQREGDVEGFGQAFILSEEQKLEWGDAFFMTTLPPHLRKPHLFHQIPQPFRQNLEIYATELEKLATTIVELMGNALKIDPKEMTDLFNPGTQTIRMNYYPPCPQPERVIGLKPHSDGGGLTILLQVNDIEGLQVRNEGLWIPVQPLPNAFIINIGDMLEIISNGIYRSIEHRATVNSEKERISLATFYGPSMQAFLAPAPSLITPERPAQYRRISVADHFKGYFSQELRGKSYLDEMKIPKGE